MKPDINKSEYYTSNLFSVFIRKYQQEIVYKFLKKFIIDLSFLYASNHKQNCRKNMIYSTSNFFVNRYKSLIIKKNHEKNR